MKIALIGDWYILYTVCLANVLSVENEVHLFVRDNCSELTGSRSNEHFNKIIEKIISPRVKLKPFSLPPGRDLRGIPKIIQLAGEINFLNPDIIHLQETNDYRFLLLRLLIKRPHVLTVHDVQDHPGEQLDRKGRTVVNYLRKTASGIFVHGVFLKNIFCAMHPSLAHKVTVINHGHFEIFKCFMPRITDGILRPHDGQTILFFGRISRYKGIGILLKAMESVFASCPGVRLVIAGRGDSLGQFAEYFERYPRKIELLNRFIRNEEVSELFNGADLVVLPYTEASQSGVIPIAYAHGKPVVVTSVGSLPEVVFNGKSGLIVEAGDHRPLAGAIKRLLGDPGNLSVMGRYAKNLCSNILSWEEVSRLTGTVYKKINR